MPQEIRPARRAALRPSCYCPLDAVWRHDRRPPRGGGRGLLVEVRASAGRARRDQCQAERQLRARGPHRRRGWPAGAGAAARSTSAVGTPTAGSSTLLFPGLVATDTPGEAGSDSVPGQGAPLPVAPRRDGHNDGCGDAADCPTDQGPHRVARHQRGDEPRQGQGQPQVTAAGSPSTRLTTGSIPQRRRAGPSGRPAATSRQTGRLSPSWPSREAYAAARPAEERPVSRSSGCCSHPGTWRHRRRSTDSARASVARRPPPRRGLAAAGSVQIGDELAVDAQPAAVMCSSIRESDSPGGSGRSRTVVGGGRRGGVVMVHPVTDSSDRSVQLSR